MPPTVSRFGPQSLSGPFPHMNQGHMHQTSHLQHPSSGLQQGLGGHLGFGGANPGIFAPSNHMGMGGGFGGGGILGGGGGTGLASIAAQAGFAHGAALQQQQAQEANMAAADGRHGSTRIRQVWKSNLHAEMELLRVLIQKYPFISMDTEFPGIVARPMGNFTTKADYHYQTLRCNVDMLKLIQLGITLFSSKGEVPPAQIDASTVRRSAYANNLIPCPCTWSFNFQFSLDGDMYAEDSIEVLKRAGVDFEKHAVDGIDPIEFGSLLITSGLCIDEDVTWLSFHSGYDFGYLVKTMMATALPHEEEKFRELVRKFFPRLYDIKFMLKHIQSSAKNNTLNQAGLDVLARIQQKSGLQDLADALQCVRHGQMHTAGSDSWMTGLVFWAMKQRMFDSNIPDDLMGQIWGLHGVGQPASAAAQQAAIAAQSTPNGVFTGMTPSNHARNDGPSTPTNNPAGLAATTPAHFQGHHGMGGATPGGQLGNFQYGR